MSRRLVDANDTRSPMLRLLEDGRTTGSDYVWVCYAAQWPTHFKARRLGYLTDSSYLTKEGKEWLAKQQAKHSK